MSNLRWPALAAACAAGLIASDAGANGVPPGTQCQLVVNGRSGFVTVVDSSPPASPVRVGGSDKPGPLTVETSYGGASQALFKGVATGRRLASVQLACSQAGEEVTYTLHDALVTAIQLLSTSEIPIERVTFVYKRLQAARQGG